MGAVLPAPSVIASDARCSVAVPACVQVASTVKLDPVDADTVMLHGVALPDALKSDAETPLTDSDVVKENRATSELGYVGVAPHVTVGAAVSMVTLGDVDELGGPVLLLRSATAPVARTGITVPSVVHVAVMVNDVPLVVLGANEHEAVPELVTSSPVRSVTDSSNESPNDNERLFVGVAGGVHADTVGEVVSGVQRTMTMPLPPFPPG